MRVSDPAHLGALFRAAALCALAASSAGCFVERSFPMRSSDAVRVVAVDEDPPDSTRAWLEAVHPRLERLLPRHSAPPLLTARLTAADGRSVDVLEHFKRVVGVQHTVWFNLEGIVHSAQASGSRFGQAAPPAWDGFDDVWIPIDERLQLSGRLGLARRGGEPVISDCIVLLAGLFGDNSTIRSRDLASALRASGHHVLALEPRGHGRTEARYPEVLSTFGVFETGDLLAVAEWLQEKPFVHETGLIGFCWGANIALLTAWEEGRDESDADVAPRLRPYLRPRGATRLYQAGVLAFSPPLRFEELIEKLDKPISIFADPVLSAIQDIVANRIEQKSHRTSGASLRELIECESRRASPDYPEFLDDSRQYLRFVPHSGQAPAAKLEQARVPVLVIYGVDDPLGQAQAIADLFRGLENPDVGAVVLPGGGHCGFAPYARRYFYSLVLNFFDRQRGVAASLARARAEHRESSADTRTRTAQPSTVGR